MGLKPIPGKEKPQPEKAEPGKLKPVPPKEKKEEATQQVSMIDKVSKPINNDQPTTGEDHIPIISQAESKLAKEENIKKSNEEKTDLPEQKNKSDESRKMQEVAKETGEASAKTSDAERKLPADEKKVKSADADEPAK